MNAVVTYALMYFAIVVLIRALPWTTRQREQKPLSCHVCMAWWTGIADMLVNWRAEHVEQAAGVGAAIGMLYVLERFSGPPPFDASSGTPIEPPK